jgi:hypothetical protein
MPNTVLAANNRAEHPEQNGFWLKRLEPHGEHVEHAWGMRCQANFDLPHDEDRGTDFET